MQSFLLVNASWYQSKSHLIMPCHSITVHFFTTSSAPTVMVGDPDTTPIPMCTKGNGTKNVQYHNQPSGPGPKNCASYSLFFFFPPLPSQWRHHVPVASPTSIQSLGTSILRWTIPPGVSGISTRPLPRAFSSYSRSARCSLSK